MVLWCLENSLYESFALLYRLLTEKRQQSINYDKLQSIEKSIIVPDDY